MDMRVNDGKRQFHSDVWQTSGSDGLKGFIGQDKFLMAKLFGFGLRAPGDGQ